MATDGPQPQEATYMIEVLTEEEVKEAILAFKARARSHGAGTRPHKVCEEILRKLTTAEKRTPDVNGKALTGVQMRGEVLG